MKPVRFKRRFLHELEVVRKRLGREYEVETLAYAAELLSEGNPLPASLNSHNLSAEWLGYSEFHLDADWLVIYQDQSDEVIFWRTGSHAELFRQNRR